MFGRSTLTRRRRRRRSVRCNPPRSATIAVTVTIPPQALLPSLAPVARWCVAGGGGWWRGKLARTCHPKKDRSGGV